MIVKRRFISVQLKSVRVDSFFILVHKRIVLIKFQYKHRIRNKKN